MSIMNRELWPFEQLAQRTGGGSGYWEDWNERPFDTSLLLMAEFEVLWLWRILPRNRPERAV